MPLSTKLKVALPLGTAITATAVTAYLIISTNNDLEKNKLVDEALENLELTAKPFEEEIIQVEEDSDEKEAQKEEDLEKKSDEKSEAPEDAKKSKEEPKDMEQAILSATKDFEKVVNKLSGSEEQKQLDIKLPEVAEQGPKNQQEPNESKPSSEEEAKQLPSPEQKEMKDEKASLGEGKDLPEKESKAAVPSTEEEKLKQVSESGLDNLQEKEQVLETKEDSTEDPILSDDQPVMESEGDISSGDPESDTEELVDQHDEQENQQIRGEATSQEGEDSSSNRGEKDGSDDEDGGAQMTEDQIKELMDLQGKMATFSDRLSNLLKGFR